VTPGWVDIHTHYDGQASWDPYLTPSSWHGVTTVVMGNCGVGFAPAAPDRHEWLIELMEGVEDIPGTALTEGSRGTGSRSRTTSTRSSARPYVIDIGAQVAHGPVRGYVMGDRGAANEPADRRRHRGDGRRSSSEGCGPGRSASRPHARRSTARSPESWCPAPTPHATSCSGSPTRWRGPATACSSSHPTMHTCRSTNGRG
jgi:hypothetical protein